MMNKYHNNHSNHNSIVGRLSQGRSVLTICSERHRLDSGEIETPGNRLILFLDKNNRRQQIQYATFHQTAQQFQPTSLARLFCDMPNLKDVSLGHLNTKKVIMMQSMFANCTSLKELDLTRMNTRSVRNMCDMFTGCKALEHVYLSPEFEFGCSTYNKKEALKMFDGCNPELQFHIMDYERDERGVPHRYEVAKYSLVEMQHALAAHLNLQTQAK